MGDVDGNKEETANQGEKFHWKGFTKKLRQYNLYVKARLSKRYVVSEYLLSSAIVYRSAFYWMKGLAEQVSLIERDIAENLFISDLAARFVHGLYTDL